MNSEHLPECTYDPGYPEPVGPMGPDAMVGKKPCICAELSACEARVIGRERVRNSGAAMRIGAYEGGYAKGLDAAREAVDRLASDMANWSSAETKAATSAYLDLSVEQWTWAQRGVYRARAELDALREKE